MSKEIDKLYKSSKRAVLDNKQLTKWIRNLEERVRKLESKSKSR